MEPNVSRAKIFLFVKFKKLGFSAPLTRSRCQILKRINSVIETYDMRINIKKTKVMKIGRNSSAMSK